MIPNIRKLASLLLLMLAYSQTLAAQEGVVTIEQDLDITTLLEYKKDVKTNKES